MCKLFHLPRNVSIWTYDHIVVLVQLEYPGDVVFKGHV